MKKIGILKGICWLSFIIGLVLLCVGKTYWTLLCVISFAAMFILDFMAVKKDNAASERVPWSEFKVSFAELAGCLAFLLIYVLLLMGKI